MQNKIDPLLVTGTLLVKAGLVKPERIKSAVTSQIGHRALKWPGRIIGYHLVCDKSVNGAVLERLIAARDMAGLACDDVRIGTIAVRNGFLSQDDLDRCLAYQDRERTAGRVPPTLGAIIREWALMDEHDLQAVIDRHFALSFRCARSSVVEKGPAETAPEDASPAPVNQPI